MSIFVYLLTAIIITVIVIFLYDMFYKNESFTHTYSMYRTGRQIRTSDQNAKDYEKWKRYGHYQT